jgi:hypothetical protein
MFSICEKLQRKVIVEHSAGSSPTDSNIKIYSMLFESKKATSEHKSRRTQLVKKRRRKNLLKNSFEDFQTIKASSENLCVESSLANDQNNIAAVAFHAANSVLEPFNLILFHSHQHRASQQNKLANSHKKEKEIEGY